MENYELQLKQKEQKIQELRQNEAQVETHLSERQQMEDLRKDLEKRLEAERKLRLD